MHEGGPSLRLIALFLGLPLVGAVLGVPLARRPEAATAAPSTATAAMPEVASRPSPARAAKVAAVVERLEPPPGPLADCHERALELLRAGYRTLPLIASVPDPVDSLHGRMFDLFVGSIRRGLEAEGFVEDGFCLPWTKSGDLAAASGAPLYREEPGWLLFRLDAADDRTEPRQVIVFLVGESPPWGVQGKALAQALTRACDVKAQAGAAGLRPKLLGPTFSASTFSLGLALRGWADDHSETARSCLGGEIEILSGSASGSANADSLVRTLAAHRADVPILVPRFRSLATSNATLQRCLLDFFLPERLGVEVKSAAAADSSSEPPPPTVALLVESSLYGQDFQEGYNLLVLPFPLNISSLRVEYDKERGSKTAEQPQMGPEALPFEPGSDQSARDTYRLFDSVGTTRTLDLELSNILSTIARRRVQMVGIVATNVRDTLFLAEALRRSAPNVRLFTFEGDLLLSHPDFASALRGTIISSTHPLRSPDPLTERHADSRRLLQFGTDATQGIFRATRELVSGEKSDPTHEQVWISVVGRAGLWHLKHLELERGAQACAEVTEQPDAAGRQADLAAKKEISARFRPPRGWTLLVALLTATFGGGVLYGVLVYFGRRTSRRDVISSDLLRVRDQLEPHLRHLQRLRHALVLLIPVVALLPYLVLTIPAFLSQSPWVRHIKVLGGLGCLALLAATVTLFYGLSRRTVRDLRLEPAGARTRAALARRLVIVTPLLLGLLALVLAVVVVYESVARVPSETRDPGGLSLVLERLIAFGSGVSPLLPCLLFLLVLLGWKILALWRFHTLEALAPDSRLQPGDLPHLPYRLWAGQEELRWALDPVGFLAEPRQTLRSVVLWALVLVAPLLYLSFYYRSRLDPLLYGVEHPVFNWLASLFFILGMICACEAGIALWRGWQALRRILAWLVDLRFGTARSGEGEGWLALLADAARPGADPGEVIRERREAACRRYVNALLGEEGKALPAAERQLFLRLNPRNLEAPTESERTILWLAIADWAAKRASETTDPPASAVFLAAAQEFFAWQSAHLAQQISSRLVQLLRFTTLALLALMVGVSCYPFEPERVLSFYTGGMVALGVALSLLFIFQAEKNPMLAKLAGTEANEINWHRTLIQRLSFFAGLPVLSLLTNQFPDVQRLLAQGLEPLVKIFQ